MIRSIPLTARQKTLVELAAQEERSNCGICPDYDRRGGPRHFAGYFAGQTWHNNGCESHGRQLQADLTFAGHSHCSCDTCF